MSTPVLYRITRRGALFTRWEWPDGTPVRGPLYQHADPVMRVGEYRPITRTVGKKVETPIKRKYGLGPGLVNTIRLTRAGAHALAHLGLRQAVLVEAEERIERVAKEVAADTKKEAVRDATEEEQAEAKILESASMMLGRPVTDVAEAKRELEKLGVDF